MMNLIDKQKRNFMKTVVHITAQVDQPELLKNLVERLAYKRFDPISPKTRLPFNAKAMDTSSAEAYVSGSMLLDFAVDGILEEVSMPYITCFMFTCIKSKGEPYELVWNASLS